MNARTFSQELDNAINQFQQDCECHGTITEEGIDIDFGKGFFTLYAEVVDDDGDFATCTQEFTIEKDEMHPFVALYFETEY